MTIRRRLTAWYGFAIAVTVALVAVTVWFHPASSSAGHASTVEVDVLDRGPGVEPMRIGMLFVPFAQRPERREGTGLGLATADAAVRALGGRIGYHERPGGGAWFRFRVTTLQAT
jgi:signal transduction histidine kinase